MRIDFLDELKTIFHVFVLGFWNVTLGFLIAKVQYVALFLDTFCNNRNILPQNSTNKLKFTHNVAFTAGKKVIEFNCLNLFGFFVIRERAGQIRCPSSGRVALNPGDRYEIPSPFFLEIFFSIIAKYISLKLNEERFI